MEVTESKSSIIMAPSTAAPSVIVALHSLVILNISEHWTRARAQLGKPQRGKLLREVILLECFVELELNISLFLLLRKFHEMIVQGTLKFWNIKDYLQIQSL